MLGIEPRASQMLYYLGFTHIASFSKKICFRDKISLTFFRPAQLMVLLPPPPE
jgi:hypothetical protein